MDTKKLMGMMNAPKHKRYQSFCTQAADMEEVWLMQEDLDVPAVQQDNLCVWPDRAFVTLYRADALPIMMEVHDFMDACRARMEKQDFVVHVFPNAKDSCDAPVRQLLESLQDVLDLVE